MTVNWNVISGPDAVVPEAPIVPLPLATWQPAPEGSTHQRINPPHPDRDNVPARHI